jgi:hypothetical protein
MLAMIMQLSSVLDMLMLRQDHLWFKWNIENNSTTTIHMALA